MESACGSGVYVLNDSSVAGVHDIVSDASIVMKHVIKWNVVFIVLCIVLVPEVFIFNRGN
jgi:hypothetical protein